MVDETLHVDEGSVFERATWPKFIRLELTNFLSYKNGQLEFSEFAAIVGPNASGKSNAVAALKLLRDIPTYGLSTAIARRGGFDQLRHRSSGRPYDPALRLTFRARASERDSVYELRLGALKGGKYRVKLERAEVYINSEVPFTFESDGSKIVWSDPAERQTSYESRAIPGQSALGGASFAAYLVSEALQRIQTVEINPARVGELQEPSSTRSFEPDGSNVASIVDALTPAVRRELIDQLAAVVPGIESVEVARLADRQTLRFRQDTGQGKREFYASQMSDGTLRAFAILVAALQPTQPALIAIEEPEVAIHLGALRSLVDLLTLHSEDVQLLITTHSADVIDELPVESLRVVWSEEGSSHIAKVSAHTRSVVHDGLITPGQLLRADALDPAVA